MVKAQLTCAFEIETHETLEAQGDSKAAAVREAVREYYGIEPEE